MTDIKQSSTSAGTIYNIKEIRDIDEIYQLIYRYLIEINQNKDKVNKLPYKYFQTENFFQDLIENSYFIQSLETIAEAYKENDFHNKLLYFQTKNCIFPSRNRVISLKKQLNIIGSFMLLIGLPINLKINQFSELDIFWIRNSIVYLLTSIEKKIHFVISKEDIAVILNMATQHLLYFHNPNNLSEIEPLKIDFITKKLNQTKIVVSSFFIIIPYIEYLSRALNKYIYLIEEHKEEKALEKSLKDLFKINFATNNELDTLYREYDKLGATSLHFLRFSSCFRTVNERVLSQIINEMTTEFFEQGKKSQSKYLELLLKQVENANKHIDNLKLKCKKILSSYFSMNYKQGEWSNKLFLSTIKTLSALAVVKSAVNDQWKIEVALWEYHHWLNNIHKIINKYHIEDGWERINDYVNEETQNIEWKSSFFTPLQSEKIVYDEKILLEIAKNIIGMMNSDGGTILVGLVEKPKKIKNVELYSNLFKKNDITFFDIKFEFNNSSDIQNHDQLKRKIQDLLIQLTGKETSYFNSYWDLHPIFLKSAGKNHMVYLINVYKSNVLTFCKGTEEKTFRLIKRLNGRTEAVDIRDFLSLTNNTLSVK